MPGRAYNGERYRWGFNGKEKVDEITGTTGTDYDFRDRIYDSRIGQWFSLDPLAKEYTGWSPYNFCMNNPIIFKDGDGKVIIGSDGKPVT